MRFLCAVILMFGMALPARAQVRQDSRVSGIPWQFEFGRFSHRN